jgi:hypothetical protein
MRPLLIIGIILLAIAIIGGVYLNMFVYKGQNEETNMSEINDITEETENQSALQMVTVYCVDNSCAPQQISIGTGTLAQSCFRDLNDCARYSINISCKNDSDCVGSTCCHPTSCINKAYKGVCNMLCTQVCQGPLDCGAGHCGCVNNRCTVIPK